MKLALLLLAGLACQVPTRPRWAYFIPDTIEGQWVPVSHGGPYRVTTQWAGRRYPLVVWADSTRGLP